MKNLILVLIAVSIFASCEKIENNDSFQTREGMPEVNVINKEIYKDSIKARIWNISPSYDYIQQIHGNIVLHINTPSGVISKLVDNPKLDTLKIERWYDLKFRVDLSRENLDKVKFYFSFENEYSTKR